MTRSGACRQQRPACSLHKQRNAPRGRSYTLQPWFHPAPTNHMQKNCSCILRRTRRPWKRSRPSPTRKARATPPLAGIPSPNAALRHGMPAGRVLALLIPTRRQRKLCPCPPPPPRPRPPTCAASGARARAPGGRECGVRRARTLWGFCSVRNGHVVHAQCRVSHSSSGLVMLSASQRPASPGRYCRRACDVYARFPARPSLLTTCDNHAHQMAASVCRRPKAAVAAFVSAGVSRHREACRARTRKILDETPARHHAISAAKHPTECCRARQRPATHIPPEGGAPSCVAEAVLAAGRGRALRN
ncbi:hypothetical protein BV25DRAFT_973981 [Artomyces pyxidatus]|uniref:Uncharacterized protein n=1 Tax=Artomyces pyxidatus TaxID=48021 RepID=A0ACB8SX45_9AGAM|nr:hypothetical protein BV25DRAFT_973981 [Artomyces pyxidatus]